MSNGQQLNLDLSMLDGLSEEERKVALKILSQLANEGSSETLKELTYGDFEEIPVDIEEFLDNDDYLGKALWEKDPVTGERRCTLWPYWRNKLKEIFPDNLTTKYNTIILTGSIGIGKSQTAVIIMLYLLYRMLCLKDPYAYYGMAPIDKITFSMLNCTIDAAKGVAWDKAQQMIQASPWFMSHGEMNLSRSNPQWKPPKGIEMIFGSNNNHVIGRCLFANLTDEVNFAAMGNNVEKHKQKIKKLISQIDARMRSRFLRGTYLPTVNLIVSSADAENAFLNSYIKSKRENESTTSLIVEENQWIVDPRKGSPEDPGAFWVAVGGKLLANELLPKNASEELVDSYRAKGYSMYKVPPGYRDTFEDNLDQALMDILGLSSSAMTKFISGVRLNEIKVDDYINPFTKEIIEVGNGKDDHLQYANFFDLSRVKPSDMSKPLFIHLDMSFSGDKTGLVGTWIEGKIPSIEGNDNSRTLFYKVAFAVAVKAPKGFQISFEKTRIFINWLREQGFAIKCVSMDTFQSAQMYQELLSDGFNANKLSVDVITPTHVQDDKGRTIKQCIPYEYLKATIYERHIKLFKKCDLLTDELIGLEKMSNGKVDHTKEGINSKDVADGLAGSVYSASLFADQYAYDYGEQLETMLDINATLTDEQRKSEMIANFEKELIGIYADIAEANNIKNKQREEEYMDYQDILDGIIVI